MKSEKGITLTSLIIYVITMLIVITLISALTSYFYKNVEITTDSNIAMKQYTQFNSYFSEEIAKSGNKILSSGISPNKSKFIAFSSNNVYTYSEESKAIYRNDTKICENVDKCSFMYELKDGRYTIYVEFQSGNFNRTGEHAIIYNIKDAAYEKKTV